MPTAINHTNADGGTDTATHRHASRRARAIPAAKLLPPPLRRMNCRRGAILLEVPSKVRRRLHKAPTSPTRIAAATTTALRLSLGRQQHYRRKYHWLSLSKCASASPPIRPTAQRRWPRAPAESRGIGVSSRFFASDHVLVSFMICIPSIFEPYEGIGCAIHYY